MLYGHKRGTTPFAAQREALNDSQDDQQDGTNLATLIVGGQEANRGGT